MLSEERGNIRAVVTRMREEAQVEYFLAKQCLTQLRNSDGDIDEIIENFKRHQKNVEELAKRMEEINIALSIALG